MPIKIPDHLPSSEVLKKEKIFVMNESRAFHQDIRPLKIGILNLMPDKQTTEVQLLRLLGNSPLQIDITLLAMETHTSKNTSSEYLTQFYKIFKNIKTEKFDGFIITGAPIEQYEFTEVTYWDELCHIMEWTKTNVTNTFHICWGAQAGLYYHYNVPKHPLGKKMSGVFPHIRNKCINDNLMRGFDETFFVPHSRHTETRKSDIDNVPELEILSESHESGLYIVAAKNGRQFFVTGHSEYDPNMLKTEYERDLKKDATIEIPKHYFRDDNPQNEPIVTWRAHASLLFSNWLNYYVYQETPFKLI